VIFGPKHQKFQEAKDLIELGVGFSINDSKELPNVLSSLNDHKMNEIKELTQSYFSQKAGATKIIMKTLERYL
jgi:3-deoxy-D-manno-octulosonic-acid transferase